MAGGMHGKGRGHVWGAWRGIVLKLCRIQDFPEGGANSRSGCANLLFFKFFVENSMGNERIWSPWGRAYLAPHLGSANVKCLDVDPVLPS